MIAMHAPGRRRAEVATIPTVAVATIGRDAAVERTNEADAMSKAIPRTPTIMIRSGIEMDRKRHRWAERI